MWPGNQLSSVASWPGHHRSCIWSQKSLAIFQTAWGTMQRCCRLSFLDDQDHIDSDDELGDVDVGDDDIDDVGDEDDLDPSQCVVSTDSWSDSCQKEKPVHL